MRATPIEPSPVAFTWTGSRSIPIEECGEPLVPISCCPERVLARPQYYFQGLTHALPEIYLREGVFERLLTASQALPSGHRFVVLDGVRSPCSNRSSTATRTSWPRSGPNWMRKR